MLPIFAHGAHVELPGVANIVTTSKALVTN